MSDLPSVPLFDRVSQILENARSRVVRSVNHHMVVAYWLIGRAIVEEEQGGQERAAYGKQIIADLSKRLTERYGRGFSSPSLWLFRQFYTAYADQKLDSSNRELAEFSTQAVENAPQAELEVPTFDPNLSWSHYRVLMRVENRTARDFYESEASAQRWNVKETERQIHTLTYERLLKSRDKKGMLADGRTAGTPVDAIKDPYVLEFLDLPESERLSESDLESALINKLREFLLELGGGFAFVARQQRLTLDGDHFYADLVFYHIHLKCYVIVDLKVEKLTHQDLGQMQMYVNYYDRECATESDNPTVGLLLCSDKNDAVVRYVLGDENQQIFASRYRLELPDEEQLLKELQQARLQLQERDEDEEEQP